MAATWRLGRFLLLGMVLGTVCAYPGARAQQVPVFADKAAPLARGERPMPKRIHLTSRLFRLPLQIDPATASKTKDVCVFVKPVPGEWMCIEKTTGYVKQITCQLPRDGEYWLTVVTIDKQGNASPQDFTREPPNMILTVETVAGKNQPAKSQDQPATKGEFNMPPPLPPEAVKRDPILPPLPPETKNVVAPERVALPPPNVLPPLQMEKQPETKSPATSDPGSQFLNSTRVGIDYNVKRIGPSGLGKLEIWITPDHGKSWKRLDRVKDHGNRAEVELPGEGPFGLRLVATNGNGFGGKTPVAGEAPSVLFEVDMTAPVIHSLELDPVSKTSTVDIRWKVSERNLGSDCVTLSYASQRGGPWQMLATRLKNDGLYTWTLPRDLPQQVFVRLEVRDLAGNIARSETTNPLTIDFTEPDLTVINVVPLPSGVVPASK
ncbi:MAG: hypothetical protein L0Y72_11035 [Gemmataceae bacterium]|nr:hypothetical protein [Gemmataceae bacterium]MCI0739570.1 hypothetical protein [Gemmataceae bacterium]